MCKTKVARWIGACILIPIALVLLLALLFYFPPFQNWAVRQVASYASDKTGMEVSVQHVNLEFPLDLGIDGIQILQPDDSLPERKDTVAFIQHIVADIQLWPLFHKQVQIDELRLQNVKVNTLNLIHELRLKGTIGLLALQAHPIDLGASVMNVDDATLHNARINLELSDTVPPDTTPSSNFWKIKLQQLHLTNTDFTLHLPGDTLKIHTYMGKAEARGGLLDLHSSAYQVATLDWKNGQLNYDNNFEPHVKGIDFNHLAMKELTLKADSFSYSDDGLRVNIRQCQFKEHSGLAVNTLRGTFAMDSTRLSLPDFYLLTSESFLRGKVKMDLNTFDEKSPGTMEAMLHGSLGKQDLLRFMADLPSGFARQWPNHPLRIDGAMKGNMRKARLIGVRVNLPTAFEINADGFVENLNNTDKLKADVDLHAKGYDLGFITAMLDNSLQIPSGTNINGHFLVDGTSYAARFTASEGEGSLKGSASIDTKRMLYSAKLQADKLQISHFLPHQKTAPFSGSIEIDGAGTDFLSPRTHLKGTASITSFSYGDYNLDNIEATANIRNGRLHAYINSKNSLAIGTLKLDGISNGRLLRGTVVCDLQHADLYHLGITKQNIIAALCGYVDVNTNFKDYYKVQGSVGDITVKDGKQTHRPQDIAFDIITSRDTTHALVNCGDFHLNADASGGYERLLSQSQKLTAEFQKQLNEKYIDGHRLRILLPDMRISLQSGRDNFFSKLLKYYGVNLAQLNLNMSSSANLGLNGNLGIDSLVVDSIQLDTIRFAVVSSDSTMKYHAQVRNNKRNPSYTFNALFDGMLVKNGTQLGTSIYDANDKLGVRMGLAANMKNNGINVSLVGDDAILGYKKFTVNEGNYIFLAEDRRVSADMMLRSDDGMGVQIYSNDSNTVALQDITVGLHQFDLEKILSVIPYTPNVSGMMNGDFHVIQTKDELSIASDVTVDSMAYERCPMGNVGTEFVYMPKSDGSHYVDGILSVDGNEVGTLSGTYKSEGDGYMDATFGMNRLPMSMINGFIPDRIVGLRGYSEGSLQIKGSLSKPDVTGEIYLDSTYLFSEPYGVEMRFANDPVRIVGSHLLFENFEMFANNDSPLNISGDFDFSNLNRMLLNVRMRAENFEIIDAKENPRSEAYGKAFVNFFGFMNGPIDNLMMRGKLDVLGSTDMTYVMRDAELTTDNQLNELVRFTNFQDTTVDVVERPPLTGLNMAMTLSVDESAHIVCMLNADHSNYIDLMGGGELQMRYNEVDGLRLTGRYTLSNGEMKYSLPIIPLRTFNIQDGSYIEFQGDPMNPKLNILATERLKATVNEGTGSGRVVEFETGVKLTQTLNNLGLQFVIDAPNDMTVQDELNTMSTEGRSKVAITMLASGMYLADGNTSAFSMNSALSSFLQGEINNVAGSALRSMGLDLGMSVDNSTTSSGAMHTDYNFKFSKRLWNNRLSVIVGGKVSTGAEIEDQNNETFFDNVELEYRLDQHSSKYLRLFYNNNKYDWLEGMIGEYGVGFKWRRKLRHFKDIFRFKSEKPTVPPARSDTLRNHQIEFKHE